MVASEVPAIDWRALVAERQEHARFRAECIARAKRDHADEERWAHTTGLFRQPKCSVCGERSTDNQPVVDLWSSLAGTYVMLAHFEGGCRQSFPELASDQDDVCVRNTI